jgi:FdhD protein
VCRADAHGIDETTDLVTVEAPLEVRLHGEPFSVIMRTPGADRELTAGFLFAEGVLRSDADVARIDLLLENVVDVRLTAARAEQLPSYLNTRRLVTTTSSCGMCGRRSLDDLDIDEPPLDVGWVVSAGVVAALPDRLRAAQVIFGQTGGLHAAGLFDRDGCLETSAEDVGRHNAVDKLLGRMMLAGRVPLTDRILCVSGRTSFEIVQKAFLGGIPVVAAVSAPSSLAVDLAGRAGVTLVGFVRDGRFNIYSQPHRVVAAPRYAARET